MIFYKSKYLQIWLIAFSQLYKLQRQMWGQKKPKDQNWQNTSTSLHRNLQQQMTPRQKQKPNIPLPNRNNLTPSRIEQRYTSSPLRFPLENAISKVTRDKSTQRQSKSRVLNKSSRRQDSSILRRGLFEDEETLENNSKAHQETIIFIKKYFDFNNLIPINHFIDRLLKQYEALWEKFNINQIIDQFTQQIFEIFGTENIDPKDLIRVTRQNGMLGLILHIFKLISNEGEEYRGTGNGGSYIVFSKSPNVMSINKSFQNQINQCANIQHLKNIIQQFMELMYKEMQNQIYSKFNVEMRRMILKGREADKILKKVQEKLVMNADYFQSQKKWERQIKIQEESIQQLKKKVERYQSDLKKEKQLTSQLKNNKTKFQEQINKLKQNLQRYQNIIFNKFQNLPSESSILPPSLSRKMTTPLMQRTQQFNNQNTSAIMNDSKPFQIQIDTHFIQRDSGPPITQTTTTFTDQNFPQQRPYPSYPLSNTQNSYSPIKFNNDIFESSRPSFEGGPRQLPKIGEYTYSPIRLPRPF